VLFLSRLDSCTSVQSPFASESPQAESERSASIKDVASVDVPVDTFRNLAERTILELQLYREENGDQASSGGDARRIKANLKTLLSHPPVVRDEAKLSLDIARLSMQLNWLEFAEAFAMQSMFADPRTWASMNVLQSTLHQAGRDEEAETCAQKQLPVAIAAKYMSDHQVDWVDGEASSDSITVLHAFPAAETILTPSLSIRPLHSPAYHHTKINSMPGYTMQLTKGKLWHDGFNIVAWDKSDRIVRKASAGYPEIVHAIREREKLTSLSGVVCFLSNRVASNYYHWMHDIMPRLGVLQDSGISFSDIDYFVVPSIQREFQRQCLDHFGIPKGKIHRFPQGRYLQADTLLMPVCGTNEQLVRTHEPAWLGLHRLQSPRSSRFLGQMFPDDEQEQDRDKDKDQEDARLRLYVSRGSNGSRGVRNDEAVIEFLSGWDFSVIRCEELTVAEQASLFRRADVVLGPHGAGFTNAVFCRPGTKIIELYNHWAAPCFWFVSEFLGLTHYTHYCDSKLDPSSSHEQRRLSNFHVDLEELAELLDFAEIGFGTSCAA